MDISPNLSSPAFDADAADPALAQHLDEIAELRDRETTPPPVNVHRYRLGLGMLETTAAELALLRERRIQIEGTS
jgi:hypothetical protein